MHKFYAKSSELKRRFSSWGISNFGGGKNLVLFAVISFLSSEGDAALSSFFGVIGGQFGVELILFLSLLLLLALGLSSLFLFRIVSQDYLALVVVFH